MLELPYQLLSELRANEGKSDERFQRDLIFAAEIAEDVGWDRLEQGGATFRQLRRDLAHDLVGVVEGTALPAAEHVRAGALLGRLGDPRPGVCTLPPALVQIEGGSFRIGNSRQQKQYDDEINDQPVGVRSFGIGRYPVTNAQYALFIANDGYNLEKPWWDEAGRMWLERRERQQPSDWEDERFGNARPNHPVVGVTWYEAIVFSRWLTLYLNDGYVYRLPTEAEWEYTARGTTGRIYPWGKEEPDDKRANFKRTFDGTTAVGCFRHGATPEGAQDMAGNVWEWTGSVYAPYPYDPEDGREDMSNPANKRFTLRGGGWYGYSLDLRASYRNSNPPGRYGTNVGFRIARHLAGM